MADFYTLFSIRPQYQLHAGIYAGAQSIPGNSSAVTGALYVEKLSGTGFFTASSGNTGGVSGDIAFSGAGWAPYDFTGATFKTLGTGGGTVTHNPDGTKTASGSYAAADSAGGNLGSASGSWALGLTPIPRGPKVEFNGAWVPSVVNVEFNGAWVPGLWDAEFNGAWVPVA